MKFLKIVITIIAIALSTSTKAALISQDLNTLGDGLLTYDDETGLQWLDLSETYINRYYNSYFSYEEIVTGFSTGGAFEGYRYATVAETQDLLIKFGLPQIDYRNESPNEAYRNAITYMSETMGVTDNQPYYNGTQGIAVDSDENVSIFGGTSSDLEQCAADNANCTDWQYILADQGSLINNPAQTYAVGHFLVVSAVPVPAAIWLFGSGLIGLVGFARRKKA